MSIEKPFIDAMLITAGRMGARLFRQNVGRGWVGQAKVSRVRGSTHVVISEARPLHAGLCTGSSDILGWRTITIQPEDVGRRVAVFVAVEVKTGDVETTDEQEAFVAAVNDAGGLGRVIRAADKDQAVRLIEDMLKR